MAVGEVKPTTSLKITWEEVREVNMWLLLHFSKLSIYMVKIYNIPKKIKWDLCSLFPWYHSPRETLYKTSRYVVSVSGGTLWKQEREGHAEIKAQCPSEGEPVLLWVPSLVGRQSYVGTADCSTVAIPLVTSPPLLLGFWDKLSASGGKPISGAQATGTGVWLCHSSPRCLAIPSHLPPPASLALQFEH